MNKRLISLSMVLLISLFLMAPKGAEAVSIIDYGTDILAIPDPLPTGTGLGGLDFIFFEHSSGGADNKGKDDYNNWHNYDDANTSMPTGGTTTVNETFVTSMGEIKDFYNYWFEGQTINQIVLFLNINETGGNADILLSKLDIYVDYTTPNTGGTADPLNNEITSATQNGINDAFSGGILIATLGSGTPFSISQLYTGTGRPDYYILTGINPYSYSDATRFLIHWESSDHDSAGGETVYLSGDYNLIPPPPNVPEPMTLSLFGLGLLGLAGLRKKSKT